MNRTKPFGIPEHRGVPLIAIWGPHTGLSYQRPGWKQVSLDQLKYDAVDWFVKWGANIVELYPSNKEAHFDDYTCKENADVPLYCFREHPDADQEHRWTLDEFIEFNRHAHQKDFLVCWMIHTWWPAPYEFRARVLWKLLRALGQDVGDILADGFDHHIDGYAAEGDFIVPQEANDLLWRYHPGIYIRESAWGINQTTGNFIQPRGFHLTDGRTLMYEREEYMGLPAECWRGWEKIWRGEEIKIKSGKLYVSLQAEGRDMKCADERWAVYGGMGTVDMLLEEVNNYARAKGRGWTTAGTTGIRVINEPLLSPKMKRYMGGICQDPIRCAICAPIEATAKDGRYPRTNYSKGTWFIQNNFYRTYINPDGKVDIHYDEHAEANFTNFIWKTSKPLTEDFITSNFDKNQELTFHECEAREEAGAFALLRQRCTFRTDKVSMDELRDYQTQADNPWLEIRIQRVFLGDDAKHSAVNTFNFTGYNLSQKLTMDKAIILTSSKNKPKLALFIPRNEQIQKLEWSKTGKLKIISTKDKSHDFKIAIMINVPDGMNEDKLTQQAAFLTDELCFDMDNGLAGEITVKSNIDTEIVRSIRILNPAKGAYMVCENGWWQMRGAQPSWNQRGTDLLKVVLSPRGSVRIRPYNFIDGIVKSGWGCQYTQLISDIDAQDKSANFTVRVLDINPKIWAPRLHFSRRIASAKINGKAWHYFDKTFLFLPNHRGDYKIEVKFGRPKTPHIVCTFACVEETIWRDNTLTVKTSLPEWTDELLEGEHYYLAVDNAGYKLIDLEGAKVVRTVPDFQAIRPQPLTGANGIATLVPREYNHPPISGYKNIKGQTLICQPPAKLKLKFQFAPNFLAILACRV